MSTRPQWEQAREIFLDLADLPAQECRAELKKLEARDPELAQQVRKLLHYDQTGSDILDDSPQRFGPYEVVRSIGRGGMGEVFVAHRADGEYEQEVAVKLLRTGAATDELVRRFQRERQTLAQLDHPYIARLLDGGTSETGEPYLVMEYVSGERADVFAAKIEVRERIELFLRIGQAVSHAHERGFVHRDLKPSNILIREDGSPRLLDFGIARPDAEARRAGFDDESLTRTGHRLFTPEFGSPEQINAETATVRTDVFALGTLLYVFLCGESPWTTSAGLHALERSICDDEPTPPSRIGTTTTGTRIARDLDAIVAQSLAKRPDDRYQTVAELCADLQRFLDGVPIEARRTGTVTRALRFARRKPAYPVVGALLLFTGVMSWIAWRTERGAEQSREELSSAVEELRSSIMSRIDQAKALWADTRTDEADAELAAALAALEDVPEANDLEAAVLAQQAVFMNLRGDHVAALPLAERARVVLEQVEQPDPRTTSTVLNTIAYSLQNTQPGEESYAAARRALEHASTELMPGDILRNDALLGWSDELRRLGEADEARAAVQRAIDETREVDPKSEILNRLLNEQGVALATVERFEEAAECYREALEILKWHRGERHAGFPKIRFNLGKAEYRLGQLDEAEESLSWSLEVFRAEENQLLTAASLHFLACVHYDQEEFDLAANEVLEALAIREQLGIAVLVTRSSCLLGLVQARLGRWEDARETLQPIVDFVAPGTLLPHMEAEAEHRYGEVLQEMGEGAAAKRHLERALQLKLDRLGEGHADCAELRARLDELR